MPDAALKNRSPDVQRQIKYALRLLDISDHPGDPALECGVGRRQPRLREACPQAFGQGLRIITKFDGAHPFAGGGDADPTQRAGLGGVKIPGFVEGIHGGHSAGV
ncbi:MAG: hypothetical protein ABS89_07555 [Thiobacillus sp. SCN 63-1177]|nr:MAG: hypothetical protein ABS89_07555 [Thiobacillus sp. SCN 63-1177]